MTIAELLRFVRSCSAALSFVAFLHGTPASAQFGPSLGPNSQPPTRNPACLRLEGQLAMIDRGGASFDPAKAEQIKRHEEAAAKQQGELDRLSEQARKLGCQGGGFFAIFSGQSPQCSPLTNQIQQVRSNLDRYLM